MNQSHIKSLCQQLNLGEPKCEPQRVYGGLLHKMWRIDTDKGVFAVKELSRDIDLNDSVIFNYNLTEEIATKFSKLGIPAINAIPNNGKYLYLLDGIGYLAYSWVHAKTLNKDYISKKHALKIAEILAKMHSLNLNVQEISEPHFDLHESDKIVKLANQSSELNLSFAADLNRCLPDIIAINESYHNSIEILKKNAVVSHGDLDQKNVLWDDNDNPILIDWESARKLNPTYEIVNAALDWSGITTEFNIELFSKMLSSYKKAGGILDTTSLEASLYGCLGNWINWMVYNIERSFGKDKEQKQIGIEQVTQVLPTISGLNNFIPKLCIKNQS